LEREVARVTTTDRPAVRPSAGDHGYEVHVLGPSPDGGVRVSTSVRRYFASMKQVPRRAEDIVTGTDGVARLRGRLFPTALVADPALARTVLTRPVSRRAAASRCCASPSGRVC
jgi:hypothetical protein